MAENKYEDKPFDPLREAAAQGSGKLVELILSQKDGAERVDRPNNRGVTALMVAALGGRSGVCKRLLQKGAQVNLQDDEGCTALHAAMPGGHVQVCRVLLSAQGVQVDPRTNEGKETPLHLAARHGQQMVAQVLLENGADIHALNSQDRTPFDVATASSKPEMARFLDNWSKGIPIRDMDGARVPTPVDLDNGKKQPEIAEIPKNMANYKAQPKETTKTTTSYQSEFDTKFDDISFIGGGAWGTVFKAKEKLTDDVCAVKEIFIEGDVQKCLEEVKTLKKMEHENIVRYYHAWLEDLPSDWKQERDRKLKIPQMHLWGRDGYAKGKYLYIQTDFCEGNTLRHFLREDTLVKDTEGRLLIFRQVVSAVKYIHGKNFIHRDLKPENIFMSLDGERARVGDFGLATLAVQRAEATRHLTSKIKRTTGTGTYLYASPEQYAGGKYGRKADIYSLGVILYEMLSPLDDFQLIESIIEMKSGIKPKEFKMGVPREIVDLVKSMVHLEQDPRPDARKVEEELDKMLTQRQEPVQQMSNNEDPYRDYDLR